MCIYLDNGDKEEDVCVCVSPKMKRGKEQIRFNGISIYHKNQTLRRKSQLVINNDDDDDDWWWKEEGNKRA